MEKGLVPVSLLLGPRSFSVGPDEPIEAVRKIMRDYGTRVVAVIEGNKLLGVVERADVLAVTSTRSEARAKDLAAIPRVTLSSGMDLRSSLRAMLGAGEWYAPVLEENEFLGFFGLEDAIAYATKVMKGELQKVRLEQIMKEPVSVKEDEPVSGIWRLMRELRHTGVPVVNEKGAIVGIVTQYDLLRKGYARIHMEAARGPAKVPRARTVMTRPCTYLYPHSTALEAAGIMINRNIARVPIAEGDKTRKLIGLVDRESLARLIMRMFG
ncbi:MAG: CBS domain-containing protein [Acidilobaceae archaeon]|nr:CBS domain-containing protein [Acidilobaceae archaeon]MCX8165663.1 CBS domain-containing protein [Acidilobaceae archaeon]MDW7974088.1 CBS domain-containing protein [Sulfolobales archaeon]